MPIIMSDLRRSEIEDFHVLVSMGYPKAFARIGDERRHPLKIGIVKDLMAAFPDIRKSVIEMFLEVYTTDESYQKACTTSGATRVGLMGVAEGEVTNAQAAAARRRVEADRRGGGALRTKETICVKTGKVGYSSGGAALENARRARYGVGERREVQAFRCHSCGLFHWGHKKPWSFVDREMRTSIAPAEASHT